MGSQELEYNALWVFSFHENLIRSWWQLRHLCSKPTNCIREIKSLTRPHDKREVALWKEAPYCM